MNVVEVAGVDDPRLADYVALRDVQLRTSLEAEHGLFLAEGEKVVRRAVAAGYRPRSFLMAPRWLDALADVLDAAGDVPVYVAPEPVIEGVTGFHVHRGALASLHRRPLPPVADVLRPARRVVVLEDLVDHTNVGAIFRCAAGLGWDAVLLGPRCADPLYRRAVKVSMGTVFSVPYTRVDEWYDVPGALAAAGFRTLALTPADDAVDLADVETAERTALLIGGEGHGLSARWMAAADRRVRIPMQAGVDSLNVAAATAVACYALGSPR
ncbi:TrmH family RNA methyltransferase [Jiangella anatolica]|uniref:rRNA methyltransferase n=1 Tax=Jiangella anatolica TaxID=2670374 RepID=A0A2W2BKV9_9ACTN|nr:RNA methyltransferase [Jiangella anatolica]PZF85930.1 rRNA methyltransferase [Jiangella anatolica]